MKRRGLLLSIITLLLISPRVWAAGNDSTSHIRSYDSGSLIQSDGSLWLWGYNQSVPTRVEGKPNVIKTFSNIINEGDLVFTLQDHSAWYVPRNNISESVKFVPLEGLQNLAAVSSLNDHVLALTNEGSIFLADQLDNRNISSPFQTLSGIDEVADIVSYYEERPDYEERWIFLKKDGSVWKNTTALQGFEPISPLKDITAIAKNIALKKDGTVWTWPKEFDKNAAPSETLAVSQIQALSGIKTIKANRYSNLAIDQQGRLWFWGATVTGALDNTTYHNTNIPVLLTGVQDVKDAFFVERSLLALTTAGNVYVASLDGEKLSSHVPFTLLVQNIQSIKAGPRHVIMQKANDALWGWGVNKHAQLGIGDYEFLYNTPVPVQKPILVRLNSTPVPLSNGVITRNGQAFIPLRSVFDQLGADITYDFNSKIAKMNQSKAGDHPVSLEINFKTSQTKVNGKSVELTNPPFMVNGIGYLPLRLISETLGAKVDWIQKEDTIVITTK
ncbi:copper amine oxidase [Paenibacillus polymyxa]|uniref:Putative E3 ubiquitin-protein ligase n=1 Tax=Paenibacillus polymyxa TaxID=1406 RepID=A0A378XUQ8_PAEPO|nr:stalk domain-containing protein [Paenibacillus polymyxa]MBE7897622.1 copper amine oxidase [Paenibacillus polymyxa]MBG9764164.1 copper amine oxidase [Paenibacillus polymyxa]MCC3260497.1 copper amine oxidase [Paenibacillus polymyxa]QPK51979.1 copper amine oxidase [Paenibacillus polymyxa]QPK57064.1 copper amine oxidase [Paenibacillus polymyxa]